MDISKLEMLNLNDFIRKLEEFRKKMTEIDYIHDKKSFFDTMKELRRYLVSVECENLYETFLHSKYFWFYKEYFTNINMYYLRSIESVQSISIMTKWIHNFDSFADLMDKEIIKQSFETKWNELKNIDFSWAKTMIMVWSWAMPETLLYIYENTNIKNIIWVDYNHEAVFMAWEMISWLNLDKITFHQWNWTHYDYSEADIVYMPLFTFPKDEILERIVETWKDNVQILITIPKWLWNLLFEWLWSISHRLEITHREDVSTSYIAQEVIKLEKYHF